MPPNEQSSPRDLHAAVVEGSREPRRVLLISYWFPPFNAIGGLRMGKLAKYLLSRGWDVRVIAAKAPAAKSMPLEIEPDRVNYTEWFEVDKALDGIIKRFWPRVRINANPDGGSSAATASAGSHKGEKPGKFRAILRKVYCELARLPDNRIGWYWPAIAAAKQIHCSWRPDIIFASAPPVTSLLIADRLARDWSVPWIAEFRDLWTDHPYYEYTPFRRKLEAFWEDRVLARAAAIITVSSPWQQLLARRHKAPTILAMNGYGPEDLPHDHLGQSTTKGPLTLLHTGHIYAGYRDPSPLFAAIRSMNAEPGSIVVEFVGTELDTIATLAEKYDVADFVRVAPLIPYQESLRRQASADILLHLQWNDPRESGTVSAKIFEYLAARRPILGIGFEHGSVADLVHARKAGVVVNDPERIVELLGGWLAQKRQGGIPALPESVAEGLTRDSQFAKIDRQLNNVVHLSTGGKPGRARGRGDVFGFRCSRQYARADVSVLPRPTLIVLVDVEEEFDWAGRFSRDNVNVESVKELEQAQDLFQRWGVIPTYLVDYPVIRSALGARLLRRWHSTGEAVVGAQLHPWVNPPFVEEVNDLNSYPGNLFRGVEESKMRTLRDEIANAIGSPPLIYRAGRFGLGPNSADLIEEMGFLIDTSVVPHTDFGPQSGPDFQAFDEAPFWFGSGRPLLELPVTRGFAGFARAHGDRLVRYARGPIFRNLRLDGIAARTGALERITLSPEGMTFEEMKRLTKTLIEGGQRVFCLSFHSPSLLPGCTPYVRTAEDLEIFKQSVQRYFDHFKNELGGVFATPLDVHRALAANQTRTTGRVS